MSAKGKKILTPKHHSLLVIHYTRWFSSIVERRDICSVQIEFRYGVVIHRKVMFGMMKYIVKLVEFITVNFSGHLTI